MTLPSSAITPSSPPPSGPLPLSSTASSSSGGSFGKMYETHCYYLLPMAGWFLFSALLSSYNKTVFGTGDGGLAFPCPLLMTSLHFFAQWVFSETVCACWPEYFGSNRISQMTWKEYLEVSVPCGLVTSADIGLSNLSWVTLSLTFYTMIKSCTPIFVLFWAYLFGITRITPQLIGVVVLITAGEFITVAGEVDQGDFQFTGFILCLSAAVLSGARWTLVQLKIQSLQPPLKTTIATMRLLSPSMFLSLLAASLMIEQPWYRLGSSMNFAGAIEIISLGLFGAIFAIAMILCEFYLIMKANAIVLAVGGVIKEVITIFVGVLFFGDRFTLRSFFGCCVIFAGVIMYKFTFTKEKERKKELLARRHLGQSGASSNKPSMGADSDETSISTAGTGTSKEEKRGLLSKMMGSGIHNSNHPPSLSPGRDGLLRSHGGSIDHDEAASLSQKDGLMRTSLKSGGAESDGWVVMPDDMGGIEMGDKSSNKTSGSGFPELKIV